MAIKQLFTLDFQIHSDTIFSSSGIGTTLELTLFGHFHVARIAGAEKLHRRMRAQTLIAHLILSGDTQLKKNIATELWPESLTSQARTNLRRELHLINTEVPAIAAQIESTSSTLFWIPAEEITVDVIVFNKTLEAFKKSTDLDERTQLCHSILKLYVGPLMNGISEDWIKPIRKRYIEHTNQITMYLVEQYVQSNELDEAVILLRQLLEADALNEAAVHKFIDILIRQNRASDAVKEFENYSELLKRELNIHPNQILYHSIKNINKKEITTNEPAEHQSHDILNHVSDYNSNSSDHIAQIHSVFKGRDEELDWLVKTVNESDNLFAELVLVSGEAGIGKTRLLEEFFLLQTEHGIKKTISQCSNTDSQIPFSTVADLLRDPEVSYYLDSLEQHFQEELIRVFPDCFSSKHISGIPGSTKPVEFRGFSVLFNALCKLLVASSENRVFCIEDLQWCDKDSLSLVEHLFENNFGRVCIVATLRVEDINVSTNINAYLNRLDCRDQLKNITLNPLTESQSQELFNQLVSNNDSSIVNGYSLKNIYSKSEGNPLYLTELARYVNSGKSINELMDHNYIPKIIYSILIQRFSSLSTNAITIAKVAAFSGHNSYCEILRLASGLDNESAVIAFEELSDRFIMRDTENGKLEFNHERIREALRLNTSQSRTRFIHNRIALAYEKLYKVIPADVAGLIADHYRLAGLTEDALRWYEQAIYIAEDRLAYHECLSLCQKASIHLDELPNKAEMAELRATVLLRQARISSMMFGFAAKSVKNLCNEVEKIRPHLKQPEILLSMLNQLRKLASFSGESESALTFARQTVTEAERYAEPVELIEAYRSLGFSEYQNGHLRQAYKALRRAVNVGCKHIKTGKMDKNKVSGSFLIARYMEAHVGYSTGRFRASRTAAKHADSLSHSHLTPGEKMFINLAQTVLLYWMRDKTSISKLAKLFDSISKEANLPKAEVFSLAFGGWAESSPERGVTKIQLAIDKYSFLSEHHFLPFWRLFIAERQLDMKEGTNALKSIRQGLSEVELHSARFLLPEFLRFEGLALRSLKTNSDDVLASFDQGLQISQMQGQRLCELRILVDIVKYIGIAGHEESITGKNIQAKNNAVKQLSFIVEKFEQAGASVELLEARDILKQLD